MRSFKLPSKEKINQAMAAFSKKERRVFAVLVCVLVISALVLLQGVNRSFLVRVPLEGGAIAEGIVGTPRFVNPVLASSPADLDIVALVYSGLMRKNGVTGPIPDLAEKYEVATDGLKYTFTLKDNVYFHNGERVTTDDVIFTIDQVKNSVITSPQKVNWEGVSVAKIDDRTLEFSIRQPNPNFLENATLGIMPKALWSEEPLELNAANTAPIGSGPYKIKDVAKEDSGVIDAYQLVTFEQFALGKPYIPEINFRFYPNEEELVSAFEGGAVNQISSLTPAVAASLKEKGYRISRAALPRVFGLFFNQNQNQLFLDKSVTRAIHDAIDKERLVREVLQGYGTVIDSPIPPNVAVYTKTAEAKGTREEILAKVKENLEKSGWKLGDNGILEKTATVNKKKTTVPLQFAIATSNAPELAAAAERIRQDLAEVGMQVEVKTFESGNLNQNVIQPRQYDALLFGQIVNRESDLFAFWHSSQRKDPGQNIAMYTNAQADKLLEEAFAPSHPEARARKYAGFENEIKKDLPAVFLYNPDFIYVIDGNLEGLRLDHITAPSDRFANIYSWFTKTENVWKIFAK